MNTRNWVPGPDWRDIEAYERYNVKIRDNIAAANKSKPLPWPDHPESGLDIAALGPWSGGAERRSEDS